MRCSAVGLRDAVCKAAWHLHAEALIARRTEGFSVAVDFGRFHSHLLAGFQYGRLHLE